MTPTPPRPVAHLELHTPDGAAARAFYTELLGWRPELIEAEQRSYMALDLGDGPERRDRRVWYRARGLAARTSSVPDIVRMTERAHKLGAEVLL